MFSPVDNVSVWPQPENLYGHLAASPFKNHSASRGYRFANARDLQLPKEPTGNQLEHEPNSRRNSSTGSITAVAEWISASDAVARH
jgi:hypothetical protein